MRADLRFFFAVHPAPVKGLFRHPELPADFLDLCSVFRLAERKRDLFFSEFGFPHQGILSFPWYGEYAENTHIIAGSVFREKVKFDLTTGTFVQGGFFLPTAKCFADWLDRNTLLVSTDFGDGSTTQAGYPRIVKRWKRGTSLEEAETLFEGEKSDVTVVGFVENTPERQYVGVYRAITAFTSRVHIFEDGAWSKSRIELPENGSISVGSTDEFSDRFFFYYEDFLKPRTMYFASGGTPDIRVARSLPHFFDTEDLAVHQYEATSADEEQIPYFVVARKDLQEDGSTPTLLYAYGGFEVSMRPCYSAAVGAGWLERGGVYVLANIRGGGEFGPKWHQAAQREKRQTSFNDFHAVAEDLIRRKITSPVHLGIMGGSNGGLLVGVAFMQRPELYRAVVCSNPLLDMKRYHTLLAGASWKDEYGDPDNPDDWKFISRYSPYHNLSETADYPAVLFTTTTHDDRVHPGHARKMAAKMTELGHDILYFENTEGGHGSGVINEQRAYMTSLEYAFLLKALR